MTEDRVRAVLRDFGVTEKEAEIYLFLAKHGTLKGGEISKRSKTHKALVYRILKNLENKGLVTPTLESPARFAAVNFETVIDLNIKAKQDEATLLENTKKELLSYWKGISRTEAESPSEKFAVIEGSHKIYAKISRMIKETEKQFSAVATVSSLALAEQYGVLDAVFSHPLLSKIRFRFLSDLNGQNLNDIKSLLRKTQKTGFDFKGRNPDIGLPLFPRMAIRDNQEMLFFITPTDSNFAAQQDDSCLWTNSKALIQAFTAVFEDLWTKGTDIRSKVSDLDSGKLKTKLSQIADTENAEGKYNQIMKGAKKEVMIMTSSEGLIAWARNERLLKMLEKKAVNLRIMAPIVNENLEAAEQLSRNHDVRHVPISPLGTTIVDGKHLFQFNNKAPDQRENGTRPDSKQTFYTHDSHRVKRITTMLNDVWKNAATPSDVTLKAFLGKSSITHLQNGLAKTTANQMISARRTTGRAAIHPPSYFNMPDMVVEVHHYHQQSAFGEGITLEVYLQLQTSDGLEFIPVAILETNPHPELIPAYKRIYAGTPAAQNIQVVKPDQLQAHLTGKNFFAGWTMTIPLPPISRSLPPSCLLFEGYGNTTNKTYTWPFPSGYKVMIDWTGFDAFITFLDPTWRYAGPSTQGSIGTDVAATAIPPKEK